jgi:UDP-GlcNAc3NAcA epimerase
MIRILTIVGARPQFIKASAFSRAVRGAFSKDISETMLHTGQHYDDLMSSVFFRELEIPEPAYNLYAGSSSQGAQTGAMLKGIEEVIQKERPDAVVVYGDTNSTLAGALAAAKMHVPIAHVEAGLRSFNKKMPEEINRVLTDHVSSFLFTPTRAGVDNLSGEGFKIDAAAPFNIDNPAVFHCGDVMYDNCLYFSEKAAKECDILTRLGLQNNHYLLATIHRESNTDNRQSLNGIFAALAEINAKENIPVVLPLHPRTIIALSDIKNNSWRDFPGFKIIPPASFFEILCLERHASMVITDSGGMQKEAYFQKNKCLVLREETEWVELMEHGMLRLAGTSKDRIIQEYQALKNITISEWPAIYGDGKAAEFICKVLLENLS